jgi:hypothetical protein
MSDESSAGPVDHLMPVECDFTRYTLTVPDLVAAKPGDLVVWSFHHIPDGWSPWIQFSPSPGEGSDTNFLGPFKSLSQSATAVWGICDATAAGTEFFYRAMIQRGIGLGSDSCYATLNSPQVKLSVVPATTGTRHSFRVTLPDSSGSLKVEPPGVFIHPGDIVEWDFAGIPDSTAWRPRINFVRYDGTGTVTNLMLGPFTSLVSEAARVTGMGNNGISGNYSFQVAAVQIDSGKISWISSDDPVIDNRGSAATTTSGGGTGG